MRVKGKSTRSAFMEALLKAGKDNADIVTVAADSQSRFGEFVKMFPERSFNVGIAEQTMIGVASGLALSGKIPVVSSYANFLAFRAIEHIRVDVAGQNLNVKIVGTDTGFSSEWLGFTHLALEDIAAIRSIPNIIIIDPSDAAETIGATLAMFECEHPVYLRIRGRNQEPLMPGANGRFIIGQGKILKDGKDVLLMGCGSSVYHVMEAANLLNSKGIEATVVNMATVRPLDENLILELASTIKKIVTVENHNVIGGLGSAVAELLAEKGINTRLLRLGVRGRFGTAGSEDLLRKEFMLDKDGIASSVELFCTGRS